MPVSIHNKRSFAIPEGVTITAKARVVNVKGPRGMLGFPISCTVGCQGWGGSLAESWGEPTGVGGRHTNDVGARLANKVMARACQSAESFKPSLMCWLRHVLMNLGDLGDDKRGGPPSCVVAVSVVGDGWWIDLSQWAVQRGNNMLFYHASTELTFHPTPPLPNNTLRRADDRFQTHPSGHLCGGQRVHRGAVERQGKAACSGALHH